MAKFDSYLLGKVRNTVGNITMSYVKKKNIAKARIFSRKDNPTPEILTQRAKMKILVTLSRWLVPVIRKGFVGVGNGTTFNAFVSMNMEAVSVDEKYVATMNYDKLKLASGYIYPPYVTVTYDEENKLFSFTQEMNMTENGYRLPDDKVYAVLFETVLMQVEFVTLRDRGEEGSTSVSLPPEWDNTKVEAYCFATLKNGQGASCSRYLTIG